MRSSALLLLFVLAACGPTTRDRDDGRSNEEEEEETPDASDEHDAGDEPDAGDAPDASDSPDAGITPDAGHTPCEPNPCTEAHRTRCRASGQTAICSCDSGYVDEGGACVAVVVDACQPNPCTQANRNVCVNGGGVATCNCNAGFVLSGNACVAAVCSPGAVSAPLQVSTSTSTDPTRAMVVWNGTHFVVVWSEARPGPNTSIWAARVRPDGTKDGADVQLVNGATEGYSARFYRTSLLGLPDGIALAWNNEPAGGTAPKASFARFDASLARVGTARVLSTDSSFEIALAKSNSGYVALFPFPWPFGSILKLDLDQSGTPVRTRFDRITDETWSNVAAASSGTVTGVTLHSVDMHFAGVIQSTGLVDTDLSESATISHIFWDGTRFVTLAVNSSLAAGAGNTVYLSAFDTQGNVVVDGTATVTTTTTFDAMAAARTASGYAVLANETSATSGAPSTTRLHRLNTSGAVVGTPTDIVSSATSTSFSVAAGAFGIGTVWLDKASSGSTEVYFRHRCD